MDPNHCPRLGTKQLQHNPNCSSYIHTSPIHTSPTRTSPCWASGSPGPAQYRGIWVASIAKDKYTPCNQNSSAEAGKMLNNPLIKQRHLAGVSAHHACPQLFAHSLEVLPLNLSAIKCFQKQQRLPARSLAAQGRSKGRQMTVVAETKPAWDKYHLPELCPEANSNSQQR